MSEFWDVRALNQALAKPEQFDAEGFLRQPEQWSPALAQAIAACVPCLAKSAGAESDSMVLSAEHLAVLQAAREFYTRYQRMPTTRVFVKFLSQTLPTVGNSLALMQLFPDTPMRWVAICAGLPKPPNCF